MEDLGHIAYEAYGKHRHWKTYDNKPMPGWSALDLGIQQAWNIAAEAVVGYLLQQFDES